MEEKPGLEPDCKTEMYTSPEYSPLRIKQEETSDLREYDHDDCTPTGKLHQSSHVNICWYNNTIFLNISCHWNLAIYTVEGDLKVGLKTKVLNPLALSCALLNDMWDLLKEIRDTMGIS